MDRIKRDTLLGLVFFGTLAFLLWATVNLTDLSVDNERLRVWFDQAGSCEVGTNVMVLGKKVGKVGAIDVDYERAENPVKMTLLLRERIPLRQGYQIEVRDNGVLGGKQIYIEPGPRNGAAVALDGDLMGKVKAGAIEQIGNIADGKGEVGQNLNGALVNIREFFGRMSDPQGGGSIAKLVNDGELYARLNDAADQLNKILTAVQDGQGSIGQLVMNRETGENTRVFLANLRSISEHMLSPTDGVLGALLNDRDTAADVRSLVDNLETLVADVRGKKGIVGRLLQDDELAVQFTNMVADLETLFDRAVDPKAGAIGALTSDPATAADIKLTLANLRQVSDQLTRGDGLIGMLLNDKDVAVRFRRIMTQVSRAIEDAREAAPIGNFIQVLLGTF